MPSTGLSYDIFKLLIFSDFSAFLQNKPKLYQFNTPIRH